VIRHNPRRRSNPGLERIIDARDQQRRGGHADQHNPERA
jgi:hypothetical protein